MRPEGLIKATNEDITHNHNSIHLDCTSIEMIEYHSRRFTNSSTSFVCVVGVKENILWDIPREFLCVAFDLIQSRLNHFASTFIFYCV